MGILDIYGKPLFKQTLRLHPRILLKEDSGRKCDSCGNEFVPGGLVITVTSTFRPIPFGETRLEESDICMACIEDCQIESRKLLKDSKTVVDRPSSNSKAG